MYNNCAPVKLNTVVFTYRYIVQKINKVEVIPSVTDVELSKYVFIRVRGVVLHEFSLQIQKYISLFSSAVFMPGPPVSFQLQQ